MNTRPYRPIPLALTTLIALFSALAALAVSGPHAGHAHDHGDHATPHRTAATRGAVSGKELALRLEMRRLWEDHITWTRLAVISLVSGSPDTDATVARLLRNQRDIGDAIKPFFGRAAANQVTADLRQHILIAADVIAAAKAGDAARLADAQARWEANADDIATHLSQANPREWKRAALRSMLGEHLRFTTQEVVARLHADWAADVAAYDRVHAHALGMADTLSTGIVHRFPGRFR